MPYFLKSATTATKKRGTCGRYFSTEGGDKND